MSLVRFCPESFDCLPLLYTSCSVSFLRMHSLKYCRASYLKFSVPGIAYFLFLHSGGLGVSSGDSRRADGGEARNGGGGRRSTLARQRDSSPQAPRCRGASWESAIMQARTPAASPGAQKMYLQADVENDGVRDVEIREVFMRSCQPARAQRAGAGKPLAEDPVRAGVATGLEALRPKMMAAVVAIDAMLPLPARCFESRAPQTRDPS